MRGTGPSAIQKGGLRWMLKGQPCSQELRNEFASFFFCILDYFYLEQLQLLTYNNTRVAAVAAKKSPKKPVMGDFAHQAQPNHREVDELWWIDSQYICIQYVDVYCTYYIHPGRLTWNLQITHLERKMIFQASMVMFHVNLPGCNYKITLPRPTTSLAHTSLLEEAQDQTTE